MILSTTAKQVTVFVDEAFAQTLSWFSSVIEEIQEWAEREEMVAVPLTGQIIEQDDNAIHIILSQRSKESEGAQLYIDRRYIRAMIVREVETDAPMSSTSQEQAE